MLARIALSLAAATPLLAAPRAAAGVREDLREQLRTTAEAIAGVMKEEKLTKLTFGTFVPTANPKSQYATGLREVLIEEVERAARGAGGAPPAFQVVEGNADMSVTATMVYKKRIDAGERVEDRNVIQVKFNLEKTDGGFSRPLTKDFVDKLGQLGFRLDNPGGGPKPPMTKDVVDKLSQVGHVIGKPELVGPMLGQTGETIPNQDDMQKKDQIGKRVESDKPQFLVDRKTRVKTTAASPFAVEILAVPEDRLPKEAAGWLAGGVKPVPVGTTKDGKNPLVELAPGTAYAIRVHIDGEQWQYDAAVEVAVDGIDVFHFVDPSLRKENGTPKYQYYICPRAAQGGYMIVPGWHHTNDESFSFVVRELGGKKHPRRVAAPAGNPGLITVRIAGAWDKGEQPKSPIADYDTTKPETDTGPPVKTGFKEVTKEIGKFNTTIAIHYTH